MSTRRRAPRRGPGRPSGAVPGQSRSAILDAARELFATQGFVRTTMRAIAAKAGVDASLVHYFFQTKEKLFSAAVELPVDVADIKAMLEQGVLQGKGRRRGEQVVRFMLERVFTSRSHAIAALIRTAVADPGSVPALRKLIENTAVKGAASVIGGPDARLRAELFGSIVVGLFVVRHVVGVEPLASASPAEVARRLGPALDALLDPR